MSAEEESKLAIWMEVNQYHYNNRYGPVWNDMDKRQKWEKFMTTTAKKHLKQEEVSAFNKSYVISLLEQIKEKTEEVEMEKKEKEQCKDLLNRMCIKMEKMIEDKVEKV
jgi:hypothetical protein